MGAARALAGGGPILDTVCRYYEAKVRRHGATPNGVDWECGPTQDLRFVQLLKLCDFSTPFSLTDLGCGYGALLSFIERRSPQARFSYLGLDVAPGMISRAKRLHGKRPNVRFQIGDAAPEAADYCVASGIFNVKLDFPTQGWEAYVESILARMNAASMRGFAFNMMSSRGHEASPPQLYRCEPERWIEHCERLSGGRVETLERYGMREFTLLVRKAG